MFFFWTYVVHLNVSKLLEISGEKPPSLSGNMKSNYVSQGSLGFYFADPRPLPVKSQIPGESRNSDNKSQLNPTTLFGPIFLLSLTQMPTALSVVVVWMLSVLFGSRDPKCGRRAGEHWGGGWAIPGPWLVLGEGCSTETSLALSLSCWFPVSSCDLLERGPAMMPPRWCHRDDVTCYKLSPVTELCCLDVQLPEPRVK